MKVNIKLLISLSIALLAGVFIGSTIADQKLLFNVVFSDNSTFINIFTVSVGGLIGAYSAFWLKSMQEGNKIKEKRVEILNSAIFVLIRQINAITSIKIDLENYNDEFSRAFSLKVMQNPSYSDLKQNIEELNFLISEGYPHLLMELTIEQIRFDQALESISQRNSFYLNKILPCFNGGKEYSELECRDILGLRNYNTAIGLASDMYKHIYSAHTSLNDKYNQLREVAKQLFPDEDFFRWVEV